MLRAGGAQVDAAEVTGVGLSTLKRWLREPSFQALPVSSPDIRPGPPPRIGGERGAPASQRDLRCRMWLLHPAGSVREMNIATAGGRELELRDLLVASDASLDPQAHVLRPDVVLGLAAQIVDGPTPYRRVRRAAWATLRGAHVARSFTLSRAEASS